jgi:hypothetical protein
MRSVSGVLMDRLPNRVLGALYRGGVSTLEDLCSCPEDHVRGVMGIGEKARGEIRLFLKSVGRGFAPERSWDGCRCTVHVYRERERRVRHASLDDRPLPENVLPFRPTRSPR